MGDLFESFGTQKTRTIFQSMVFIESGNSHVREKKDVITVDATIEQNHSFSSKASEHPTEGGENIVDNIDLQPITLSIRGILAKEPLTIVSSLVGNFAGATNVATQGQKGLGIVGHLAQTQLGGYLMESIYGDRAKAALETLLLIWEEKRLIDIVTKIRVYDDMIIESISIPHNITHGDSIEFTANLRQVKIVESETSQIMEKVAVTNTATTAGKGDKGRQGLKNVGDQKSDDIKGDNTTKLYKALDLSLKLLGFSGLH